jgi:hypothetical protein
MKYGMGSRLFEVNQNPNALISCNQYYARICEMESYYIYIKCMYGNKSSQEAV